MATKIETFDNRLSVLMPVLNGMPYLEETLESLLAQSFKNFELLVWDNGSTDGTLELLSEWIPHRLPGRIFHDHPLSLGGSLAELVLVAQTELCARIDADDICHPERFKLQIAQLIEDPGIDVLGSQLALIGSSGVSLNRTINYPLTHIDIVCRMLSQNPIGHPSVMFRKSSILRAGNYDPTSTLEDYDLWLRMTTRFQFQNLPQVLVDYRLHDESYTRNAERAGVMLERVKKTLVNNATHLFGLSKDDVEKLTRKEDPKAFNSALQVSRHLAGILSTEPAEILRNRFFLDSMNSFTSETDTLSLLQFGFRKGGAYGAAKVMKARLLRVYSDPPY